MTHPISAKVKHLKRVQVKRQHILQQTELGGLKPASALIDQHHKRQQVLYNKNLVLSNELIKVELPP